MAQDNIKKVLHRKRNQEIMENNLKRHGIIATLCDKAEKAIYEGERTIDYDLDGWEHADELIITHETPCGTIELYCEVNSDWQVYIDNTTAHTLDNLHEALRKALPRYQFDFETARQESAREAADYHQQCYELAASGYFM